MRIREFEVSWERSRAKSRMNENLDDLDLIITDEDLRMMQEAWDAKFRRIQHPYVFDLIKLLAPYPKLKRTIALDWLHRNRMDAGLSIPPSFDSTVQASLQYYCDDSDIFIKRGAPPGEAIFSWPDGKGAGQWALKKENARVWVRENRALLKRRLEEGRI
jgi:hypothetical protein